ncbi:hypothetical protein N0V86_000725 [Didymella sp. IMI 355093]|nr:hypothetical protein N0V86_000725 [Didymella sp. IMI 355093]
MSEPSKKPDPPKSDPPKSDPPKSDPPKKLEARTAGASNTDVDVFELPDFPEDEPSTADDEHSEEKISMTEALKMKSKDWAKAARRKSGQILTGFGSKKDEDKNDGDKKDGSKDGGPNTNAT